MSDAENAPDGSAVDINEVVVSRDDEGLIVPEEVYVEEFGDTVVARTLNKAGKEKYIAPFIEALQVGHAVIEGAAEGEIDVDELSEEDREKIEEKVDDALPDDKFAEMLEEHIVEPDLIAAYDANRPDRDIDSLDAEFVDQELKPGAEDGLFFAILLASDMEDLVEVLRGNVPDEEEAEEGNS